MTLRNIRMIDATQPTDASFIRDLLTHTFNPKNPIGFFDTTKLRSTDKAVDLYANFDKKTLEGGIYQVEQNHFKLTTPLIPYPDTTPVELRDILTVPDKQPKFMVLKSAVLGVGSYGIVLNVEGCFTDQFIAKKNKYVVKIQVLSQKTDYEQKDKNETSFIQWCKLWKQKIENENDLSQRIPYLATQSIEIQSKEKNEAGYIASKMRFVEGVSLYEFRKKSGNTITADQYLMIFKNMCLCIQAIHDKGVMHCDLNRSNFHIDPNTLSVRAIDFGTSCAIGNPHSTILGTYPFASTEMMAVNREDYWDSNTQAYKSLNERTDWASVGYLMSELCGDLRFYTSDVNHFYYGKTANIDNLFSQNKSLGTAFTPSQIARLKNMIAGLTEPDKNKRCSLLSCVEEIEEMQHERRMANAASNLRRELEQANLAARKLKEKLSAFNKTYPTLGRSEFIGNTPQLVEEALAEFDSKNPALLQEFTTTLEVKTFQNLTANDISAKVFYQTKSFNDVINTIIKKMCDVEALLEAKKTELNQNELIVLHGSLRSLYKALTKILKQDKIIDELDSATAYLKSKLEHVNHEIKRQPVLEKQMGTVFYSTQLTPLQKATSLLLNQYHGSDQTWRMTQAKKSNQEEISSLRFDPTLSQHAYEIQQLIASKQTCITLPTRFNAQTQTNDIYLPNTTQFSIAPTVKILDKSQPLTHALLSFTYFTPKEDEALFGKPVSTHLVLTDKAFNTESNSATFNVVGEFIEGKFEKNDRAHVVKLIELPQSSNTDNDLIKIEKQAKQRRIENEIAYAKNSAHLAGKAAETTIAGKPFQVLKMYQPEGMSLREFLEKNESSLTQQERLVISENLIKTVMRIHDKGYVYYDLTPNHLFINNKTFEIYEKATGAVLPKEERHWDFQGSLAYTSKEFFEQPATADYRTDIVSVGLILSEAWGASNREKYVGKDNGFGIDHSQVGKLALVSKKLTQKDEVNSCQDKIWELLSTLTKDNPAERNSLQSALESIQDLQLQDKLSAYKDESITQQIEFANAAARDICAGMRTYNKYAYQHGQHQIPIQLIFQQALDDIQDSKESIAEFISVLGIKAFKDCQSKDEIAKKLNESLSKFKAQTDDFFSCMQHIEQTIVAIDQLRVFEPEKDYTATQQALRATMRMMHATNINANMKECGIDQSLETANEFERQSKLALAMLKPHLTHIETIHTLINQHHTDSFKNAVQTALTTYKSKWFISNQRAQIVKNIETVCERLDKKEISINEFLSSIDKELTAKTYAVGLFGKSQLRDNVYQAIKSTQNNIIQKK